jgi:hypothetical protein
MNSNASNFLKDLRSQLVELLDDNVNSLDNILPDHFKDDLTENVFGKISSTLYEIETMLSDVEDGHYDDCIDDSEDEDYTDDDFY